MFRRFVFLYAHMKITHTVIQDFLDNKCTAQEAEMVARHLKKHPELMAVYLKSAWDDAGKESGVPAGYTAAMNEAINAQIGKRTRIIRFRQLVVAASLLVAATAIWLFSPHIQAPQQTLVKAKQTAAPPNWKTTTNTYAKASIIQLEDGSIVKLAPHAVIKYQEPFGQQAQRNIDLKGEADFDVAHDKARPFTVHTSLFSTTALGTSFRVSASAMTCNIKLFRGKVLIKSMVSKLKGWKTDIILLPGNEMKYSVRKGTVHVVPFNAIIDQYPQARNNEYPEKIERALIFDNTALPEVMKTLTARYHTPIFYNEKLLTGKYFSGEVRKSDSLSVLLKVITNMNGLQVTKNDNGYIITGSK
jgi:transmembrane sensor